MEQARDMLSLIYFKLSVNSERQINYLYDSLENDISNVQARKALADAYQSQGNYDEAFNEYR